MSGAPLTDDLAGALEQAGFEQIVIEPKPQSAKYIKDWLPGSGAEDFVVSANITAVKPGAASKATGPALAEAAVARASLPDEDMPARMRARLPPKQKAVEC